MANKEMKTLAFGDITYEIVDEKARKNIENIPFNDIKEHIDNKGNAFVSGLYKITTNKEGHITSATPVTKEDIVNLGIPESDTDTTYDVATQSNDGLLSKEDKNKIDDSYKHSTTNKGKKYNIGFYKIQTNDEGHVTSATLITADDIIEVISKKIPIENIIEIYSEKIPPIQKGEGIDSVKIGQVKYLVASGDRALACGNSSKATQNNAVALNAETHADGIDSMAINKNTVTKEKRTFAAGNSTIAASIHQFVFGKFNIENADDKYVHIIGNGTSNTARSNAHTLSWEGQGYFARGTTMTGADYAEYFEWMDGNPDNEDRVGLLVTLDGERIRLANAGDEILGIISGTAAVLGDNYECEWNGKYLTDDFGRVIYDMVEEFSDEIVGEDEEGNPIIEKQSLGFFKHPRINPDYDPEQAYVNRSDRPEWDTVGMLGKLYVRDDGTCQANGYATVGENGVATASLEKTNMRVLSRVNENIVRVLLK